MVLMISRAQDVTKMNNNTSSILPFPRQEERAQEKKSGNQKPISSTTGSLLRKKQYVTLALGSWDESSSPHLKHWCCSYLQFSHMNLFISCKYVKMTVTNMWQQNEVIKLKYQSVKTSESHLYLYSSVTKCYTFRLSASFYCRMEGSLASTFTAASKHCVKRQVELRDLCQLKYHDNST